VAFNSSSS